MPGLHWLIDISSPLTVPRTGDPALRPAAWFPSRRPNWSASTTLTSYSLFGLLNNYCRDANIALAYAQDMDRDEYSMACHVEQSRAWCPMWWGARLEGRAELPCQELAMGSWDSGRLRPGRVARSGRSTMTAPGASPDGQPRRVRVLEGAADLATASAGGAESLIPRAAVEARCSGPPIASSPT